MRIGTWNLAGRWDARHQHLLESLECDVLLLTEVPERMKVPGLDLHLGQSLMAPGRRWAAVASRVSAAPEPDPHGASAMVRLQGVGVCSSVLPWRSCGPGEPWDGATTATRTEAAVEAIEASSPTIWGGDWNHAWTGREWSGSHAGRAALLASTQRLGLQVATATAPHQIPGLLTIDHIAVPAAWTVLTTRRRPAQVGQTRLSDHDAYVVEAVPLTPP